MLGIKCSMPNGTVNGALRDQHLLAVPAGDNVIRLLPPLTVTEPDIQEGLKRIRGAAKGLSEAVAAAAK